MSDAAKLSELTDHLGYWLRFVSNHVSHAFARKLEERDVTVAEWVLMRELYDADPMAPSRLADRMGVTRGAVSKLADRLLAKALLRREASPDDGRAQTLSLTDDGRRLVPELALLADENDAEFFGHLDAADRRSLQRLLQDIVERRGLKSVPVT